MAVFIGRGEAGPAKLVNDGQFPTKAGEVLNASYVSVYVDTDSAAGKALAAEFGLSEGLVISNRGGKLQALRHTGTLTPTQLNEYLVRYADTMTVATTAAGGYAVGGGCAGGACGYAGGYAGGASYCGASGGYGSGCSTGYCGGGSCGGGRSCGGGSCGGGRRGGRCR
jgi:hypothetical protein